MTSIIRRMGFRLDRNTAADQRKKQEQYAKALVFKTHAEPSPFDETEQEAIARRRASIARARAKFVQLIIHGPLAAVRAREKRPASLKRRREIVARPLLPVIPLTEAQLERHRARKVRAEKLLARLNKIYPDKRELVFKTHMNRSVGI